MNPINSIIPITLAAGILVGLSGCEGKSAEQSLPMSTHTPDQASETNAWVLASAPEGAISITEAKATAKEGDTVVIRGRIGGRHSPITADSPVFTIMDLALPYCGQHEDDGCPTPWDYCCETPSTIGENAATVQIVGEGTIDPIAGGLSPLDEIILIGTVAPRPNQDVLTIKATGIFTQEG